MLLSEDQIYVKEVEHVYCMASRLHKEATLYRLLEFENPTSSMIFCNTREETRQVVDLPAQPGPRGGDALVRPAAEEARAGDGGVPRRADPPPGDDRRGLARDRHRGPLARLHLLDARLARAVHPPRRPHRARGQERPRDQPDRRLRPDELQPPREALPRRGARRSSVPTDEEVQDAQGRRASSTRSRRPAGACRSTTSSTSGPRRARIAAHELRDRIVALLLQGHLAAPAPAPAEEDEAEPPEPARRRPGDGGRRRRRVRAAGGSRRAAGQAVASASPATRRRSQRSKNQLPSR